MIDIGPSVLDAAAAARYMGISSGTLAKMRLAGTSPLYLKLGRRVLYRRVDLDAWLETRVARNTSDAQKRLPKSLTGPRVEKTNGRLKDNPDTAPTRLKQASEGPTANTDAGLSKATIGKSSTSRASGTRKS